MQQLLSALLGDENAELSSGGTPFGKNINTNQLFNVPGNVFPRFNDFNVGLGPGVSPLALLAVLYVASRFTSVQQPQFIVPPIYIIDGKLKT